MKHWPTKRWTRWLLMAFASATLTLGVATLVFLAIMGRVCTDAKAVALQNPPPPAFFGRPSQVLNIAHRGASKLAPEHSLAAYELALEQGADVLELDLRLTRDEVLVVAHDGTLKRTLGVETKIAELTLAELEGLAGSHTPLRLDQVFAFFPAARFNLELKDEDLSAATALAAGITRFGAAERVLVASVHQPVLAELRRATAGAVATSASLRESLHYYFCQLMERTCPAAYSGLQLPALGWLGLTSPGFVARAHERGLWVHFWTVDDPGVMRRLLAAGADGIMTNRPDVLERLLKEHP